MAKHYIEVCDQSFGTSLELLGINLDTSFIFSALQMAKECGLSHFEALNKDRFFSLAKQKENPLHYLMSFQENCQLEANLQINAFSLAPFSNELISNEFIEFFVKAIAKSGATTLGVYDILNDMKNLQLINFLAKDEGLLFEAIIFLDQEKNFFDDESLIQKKLYQLLDHGIEFDSLYFLDTTGIIAPKKVYETIKEAKRLLGKEQFIRFGVLKGGNFGIASYMGAVAAGANSIDVSLGALSSNLTSPSLESLLLAFDKEVGIIDLNEQKLQEYSRYLFSKAANLKFNNCFLYTLAPFHTKLFLSEAKRVFQKDRTLFFKILKAIQKVKKDCGYAPYSFEMSEIYWAQAFLNVMHGEYEILDEKLCNILLGYFGHTPIAIKPELFEKAQKTSQKMPCFKEPFDCIVQKKENSLKYWTLFLQENGYEANDKNLFLAYLLQEECLDILQDSSLETLLHTLESLKKKENLE